MKKGGKKPRFVVDQNIYYQDFVSEYGIKRARFYSVQQVTGNASSSDPEILDTSATKDIHIITKNDKHFRNLLKSKPQLKIGIVGIGVKSSNFIKKFSEVLNELPYHEDYRGKLIRLGNKVIIKNTAST